MLDAQRLAVLAEVAHAGSIASAAQRLAFTPSAVSQQIGKLERDLGCRLLHRHARGVTLTPAGQVLLSHAETVIGELRTAEQAVRAELDSEPARLAVGSFASAGQFLIPQALARFRQHHPDVALALLDLEPPDGYGLVRTGDLDLLITHRYPGMSLPDPRGLARQLLMRDPLLLILPATHPLASKPELTITELALQDWISGADGMPNRVCLELAARSAAFQPRIAYETRDYQLTLTLIGAGLGISLVPASVLGRARHSGLTVRRLSGTDLARDIYLLPRRRPTTLVTSMITVITQLQRELPPLNSGTAEQPAKGWPPFSAVMTDLRKPRPVAAAVVAARTERGSWA
jgi:DNA-binding transcriptional LysR family regulator